MKTKSKLYTLYLLTWASGLSLIILASSFLFQNNLNQGTLSINAASSYSSFYFIPSPDPHPPKYSQKEMPPKGDEERAHFVFLQKAEVLAVLTLRANRKRWSSPSHPQCRLFLYIYSEIRKWWCSWRKFWTLSSDRALAVHFVIAPPPLRSSFPSSALKGIPDPNRPHGRTAKAGKARRSDGLGWTGVRSFTLRIKDAVYH